MLWLYLAAFTFGLMQLVPTVLAARDRHRAEPDAGPDADDDREHGDPRDAGDAGDPADSERNQVLDFLAFSLFVAGAVGLISLRFEPQVLVSLLVSLCLGAAVGAVHPELLGWLARFGETDPELEPVE